MPKTSTVPPESCASGLCLLLLVRTAQAAINITTSTTAEQTADVITATRR